MNDFKPYVFLDTDIQSDTLGLWSIRWSESMGFDGYSSEDEALEELRLMLLEEEYHERM